MTTKKKTPSIRNSCHCEICSNAANLIFDALNCYQLLKLWYR
jgi:hypothetical protein